MYVLRILAFGGFTNRLLSLQVRTKAVPKSARKRDWLRPLWLLGMLLYM
jgi:hypothetical protein